MLYKVMACFALVKM